MAETIESKALSIRRPLNSMEDGDPKGLEGEVILVEGQDLYSIPLQEVEDGGIGLPVRSRRRAR